MSEKKVAKKAWQQTKPKPAAQPQWRPVGKKPSAAEEQHQWPQQAASAASTGPAVRASQAASSFIPPGCDSGRGDGYGDDDEDDAEELPRYEDSVAKGFWCPPRLCGRNGPLIEAVNDWHFAMLNDSQRNQFYWDAMKPFVEGKRVVDIGAGSGLLSLMAAKLGAESVVAIEGTRDMVDLAQLNVKRNGQADKVKIIHNLSSKVNFREAEKADVIVSETLGALMLGEGTLDYMADARRRLAKRGAIVIPAGGAQYAVLISSPSLAMVSSVQKQCSMGFDLSAIGSLQDTGNIFFTKQWGFRLNSLCDLTEMSDRVCILEVDFQRDDRSTIPAEKKFHLKAARDGVVHAVVASWEVYNDSEKTHRITTHPADTKNEPWGFARDMQWGQGLQLVEDYDAANVTERHAPPGPFEVTEGEELILTVRFSAPCRQTFQFTLQRASAANGLSNGRR